jgi:hypothetical protein
MRQVIQWIFIVLIAQATGGRAAELALPKLTINGEVHTNVLVTGFSKGRITVQHSAGLGTVRVTDLEYDVLKQLSDAEIIGGPAVKELLAKKAPKKQRTSVSTNEIDLAVLRSDATLNDKATVLARAARTRLEKETKALGIQVPDLEKSFSNMRMEVGLGILGGFIFLYLLRSWCFFRICVRATGRGSVLVFAPLLRWFPLADAAKMSRQWLAVPVFGLLGFYLPPVLPQLPWVPLAYLSVISLLWIITLILFIVWCVRVSKTLQHGAFVSFLLMLPLLDWFALLYLALSGEKSDGRISLKTRPAI